jgi:predicted RecA/RadA family phage recombinase
MKNFIQCGKSLTIPAPAAVTSGDIVIAGSIVGIAAGDAESGADVDVVTEGVFDLPKVSALAITLGATVYYDSSTGLVNTTASGNTKLGHAVAAAANPSASVNVKLIAAA